MPVNFKKTRNRQGVSIITCTNRQSYMINLFQNYRRQHHVQKELIIIVNDDKTPLLRYQQLAAMHLNVKIYHVPERYSLGACLNFAVKKSKYSYIAKFDDDDFYTPYYLTDCLQAFKKTNADIIGKKSHFMYLRGSRTLLLRYPRYEHKYVTSLPGATLVVKRKVFSKVQFPDLNLDEDTQFCIRSKKKGFKIYSAGKYNFIAIRRKNSFKHTWIISDKTLIARHKTIRNVRNFKRFVQRKPIRVR